MAIPAPLRGVSESWRLVTHSTTSRSVVSGAGQSSLVVHKTVAGGHIFQMFGNLGLFHRKYEFCPSSHI